MTYTAWFDGLGREASHEVGGKAAELGVAALAGLPLPPGFVVTTAATRDFYAGTRGLEDEIAHRLASVTPGALDVVEHGAAIASAIRAAPVPEPVARAISDAYRALGCGDEEALVAVRASIDPDDADARVPTMLATVLDVAGEDALLDAVRACWASSFDGRILHRLAREGLLAARPHLGVAVLVQRMIDADKAGLAFPMEPESGDPSVIVIESAFGLGEPVVRGDVDPDRFVVDKATLAIRDRRLGGKRVEVFHDPEHARRVRRQVSPDRAASWSLDEGEIRGIAELVRREEERLHTQRALEFAIDGSSTWVLESRPVDAYRMRRVLAG